MSTLNIYVPSGDDYRKIGCINAKFLPNSCQPRRIDSETKGVIFDLSPLKNLNIELVQMTGKKTPYGILLTKTASNDS